MAGTAKCSERRVSYLRTCVLPREDVSYKRSFRMFCYAVVIMHLHLPSFPVQTIPCVFVEGSWKERIWRTHFFRTYSFFTITKVRTLDDPRGLGLIFGGILLFVLKYLVTYWSIVQMHKERVRKPISMILPCLIVLNENLGMLVQHIPSLRKVT